MVFRFLVQIGFLFVNRELIESLFFIKFLKFVAIYQKNNYIRNIINCLLCFTPMNSLE